MAAIEEEYWSTTDLPLDEIREVDTLRDQIEKEELGYLFSYLDLSIFLSKISCCDEDAANILAHFRKR